MQEQEREPHGDNQDSLRDAAAIEAVRVTIRDEDVDMRGNLLAYPDGPESNLSERHWRMVRTPTFKQWFGDWQSEAEEHSSIVDENGEPMLVFHEASKGVHASDENYFEIAEDQSLYERGLYFATRKGILGEHSRENSTTLLCFLNIRHTFRFEDEHGEALLIRNLLNFPDKETAVQNAIDYLDIPGLEKQISDLQEKDAAQEKIIFGDTDSEQKREEKLVSELSELRLRLQRATEIVETLPRIYDEVHTQRVGVMYMGKDQKLSYEEYTEIVVFRAEQIVIVEKISGA